MIIKSDFRDYYDIGLKHGHDKSRVYERKTTVCRGVAIPHGCRELERLHEEVSLPWWLRQVRFGRGYAIAIRSWVFGFCGKLYPMFNLYEGWYWKWMDADELGRQISTATFSVEGILEKAREWIQLEFKNPNRLYRDFLKNIDARPPPHYNSPFSTRETLERVLARYRGSKISDGIFVAAGTPIFCYWEDTLVVNPRLADTDFIKIMPPIQAFQEIEMYLGGPLAPPDIAPRTVGDDRLLAQQKGFDDQSFRQLSPGEKKLRRKQNRERKRKERGKPEA